LWGFLKRVRAIKSPAGGRAKEGVINSLLCFGRKKRVDRLAITGTVYCWILNICNKKLAEVGLVERGKLFLLY
jgi:hypothetical protein